LSVVQRLDFLGLEGAVRGLGVGDEFVEVVAFDPAGVGGVSDVVRRLDRVLPGWLAHAVQPV
jgi:hypothetical protein